MKKIKRIGFGLGIFLIIAGIYALYYWLFGNWTIWYRSELNRFFGKGNWEVVSEDVNRSYVRVSSNYNSSVDSYGRIKEPYRDWNILCRNKDGEEEVWKVSNHVYKVNHARYNFFSSKRYKARQALTLELMDISFERVEEEVHNEIVKQGLTEEEAHCIYVDMSYHGGNPKGSFYDKLAKEPWFTIDGISAENYLACDLYDFYILIRIHDYRLEELSEQEQDNVVNALGDIEKRMLEEYGDHASFEILYDEYRAEYVDGIKQ